MELEELENMDKPLKDYKLNPADIIDEEDVEESMGESRDLSMFKKGRNSKNGSLNQSLSKSAIF